MNDKERISDLLMTEKKLSANCDAFASECVNLKLRDAFLNIGRSSHDTQTTLFEEAQSRGWYQTTPADGMQINQAYQTFSAMNA